MALSEDKQWAAKYLLDPLTAPEPSDETGPGTSFGNSLAPAAKSPSKESVSKKSSQVNDKQPRVAMSISSKSSGYPTPPSSASPRQERFNSRSPSIRQEAFGSQQPKQDGYQSRDLGNDGFTGRRRTSSLTGRFAGDQSHRPLDLLKHENKLANRSPHLRKKHLPGPDSIDILDANPIGPAYHHEGPFDATLLARNISFTHSPVGAVSGTNAEALRATPQENIQDSLRMHRPLDGTASIPSGMRDYSGRHMQYEEGSDLMIEGGNYKRWPGVTYLPEDLKGKGEPSYSIEKALKEGKSHRRAVSDGDGSYEMVSGLGRSRSSAGAASDAKKEPATLRYKDWEQNVRRSGSERMGFGEGLKKRLSLRKRT